MLNFRKLKQDFPPAILQDGKKLYEKDTVLDAKIVSLDNDNIRISSRVQGNFDNTYECEIEIDRFESEAIDSNCDCPYNYDCQHLAALLFYLEEHLDAILVNYSKETDIDDCEDIDEEEKEVLKKTIKTAAKKQSKREDAKYQKEILQEYTEATQVLSLSPFFYPKENLDEAKAELALIATLPNPGALGLNSSVGNPHRLKASLPIQTSICAQH